MKTFTTLLCSLLIIMSISTLAQVAINTDGSAPVNSAMLDVKSTNKGLLLPRMTVIERNDISSPATGLIVFVTDDNNFYYWDGSAWVLVAETNPTGPAGGDLSSTYPNPTVKKIQNNTVSPATPTSGQVLKWNGSMWAPQTDENLDGSPAGGDLSNTYPTPTVAKIQTQPVSSTAPATGEVLKWSGAEWIPQSDAGLTLPYTATYAGSSDALNITHNGSSGHISDFYISNSSNTSSALNVRTNGTGEAAEFKIDNFTNDNEAIYVSTNGTGRAGYFKQSNTSSNADAVKISQDGNGEALYVITTGDDNAGYFQVNNSSNSTDALYVTTNGTGRAAYFGGNIFVNGAYSGSGGKYFLIDHPNDPENKLLRHSCIESNEMTNIYKGRGKLRDGIAIIALPDYFEALNHPDKREINLTCVNGWSPLYLDGNIENNQFIIKTTAEGKAEQEFSWVIYAVAQIMLAEGLVDKVLVLCPSLT
ncbi:MAG: hypothetical protein HQ541_00160, partial [Mariniphaga sp.]|nr:hypothetical protein [Mariniphaga sp.]